MSVYSRFLLEGDVGIDTSASDLNDNVDIQDIMDSDNIEKINRELNSGETQNLGVMAAKCCAENTINFNAIMEACAIEEFCAFEESGVEMLTEASVSGFFEAAKNFFKKIWEKIQSIFKKVAMQFASWSKNDKEFYNKYKKEIAKVQTAGMAGFSDVEVKVYPYTYFKKGDFASGIDRAITNANNNSVEEISDLNDWIGGDNPVPSNSETDPKAWEDALKKVRENQTDMTNDILDEFRADLISEINSSYGNSCSASEFTKDLAEALQGDTTKDTEKLTSVLDDALATLAGSDKIKTNLNKLLAANKKSIDKDIKSVIKYQKQFDKERTKLGNDNKLTDESKIAGTKYAFATIVIGILKQQKNIQTTFDGAVLQHYKAYTRQCKAICVKAATFVPKNESASFQTESSSSLLGSIEMI